MFQTLDVGIWTLSCDSCDSCDSDLKTKSTSNFMFLYIFMNKLKNSSQKDGEHGAWQMIMFHVFNAGQGFSDVNVSGST